ncbi:hypothetical protein [Oribacterium sp. P6A1]|uniref:hypothetical protein n=1 Tax=Oribacterium sp. P6A1 TaxID=1410612 RepID=UPI000568D425|nr:hypothetical protein [Oribacterium sp. P6A1]
MSKMNFGTMRRRFVFWIQRRKRILEKSAGNAASHVDSLMSVIDLHLKLTRGQFYLTINSGNGRKARR